MLYFMQELAKCEKNDIILFSGSQMINFNEFCSISIIGTTHRTLSIQSAQENHATISHPQSNCSLRQWI